MKLCFKNRFIISLVCSLFLICSAHAQVIDSPVPDIDFYDVVNLNIERLSTKYRVDPMLAAHIIQCESGTHPYTPNINKNGTTDYGFWQINSTHRAFAWKYGFDIENPLDNLEFGFLFLKQNGTSPWNASKACWSKL